MNLTTRLLCVPVMLLSAAFHTRAQENSQPQPPPKYRIELVYIFEADSPEFVSAIGGVGFKSVASLKKFLNNLPSGSTLKWAVLLQELLLGYNPLARSSITLLESYS